MRRGYNVCRIGSEGTVEMSTSRVFSNRWLTSHVLPRLRIRIDNQSKQEDDAEEMGARCERSDAVGVDRSAKNPSLPSSNNSA